jgi:hypothetical protein
MQTLRLINPAKGAPSLLQFCMTTFLGMTGKKLFMRFSNRTKTRGILSGEEAFQPKGSLLHEREQRFPWIR